MIVQNEYARILADLGAPGTPDDYEWITIPVSLLAPTYQREREKAHGTPSTRTRI